MQLECSYSHAGRDVTTHACIFRKQKMHVNDPGAHVKKVKLQKVRMKYQEQILINKHIKHKNPNKTKIAYFKSTIGKKMTIHQ